MYQLAYKNFEGIFVSVFKLPEMCVIPFDPANTDYAEYLKWLAEGNEPLPADDQSWQNAPST